MELRFVSRASTTAGTGVEMEALTAVSVAALTVYDMCKALDKGIEIRYIQLERKRGGKSGEYQRPPGPQAAPESRWNGSQVMGAGHAHSGGGRQSNHSRVAGRIAAPLASVRPAPAPRRRSRGAEEQTPDLIVSDFRMPGLSGLELLAKLRQPFPHVAVVMLASRADIAGPLAGCSPLVEEFIEKPFFIEDATARIKRVSIASA